MAARTLVNAQLVREASACQVQLETSGISWLVWHVDSKEMALFHLQTLVSLMVDVWDRHSCEEILPFRG